MLDYPTHNYPMQVRLKQLAVLVKVFVAELAELSLRQSLEAVLAGDFISDRNLQPYMRILAYMYSVMLSKSVAESIDLGEIDNFLLSLI